jgi:signal transduction histidine kinase
MADSAQMERVLQNLLSNALKYRGEATPVVKVESEDRDRLWCIRVCDNGVGLPEDQRERVFRIFQRAHSRNEYPGTGMGLAICRKIVERHGGRIWLEDSPLGGICVAFTLPKVREAAPQPEPQKV